MRVYNDLFQEEGSEIYLKPVSNYVKTGVPVNFYTVLNQQPVKMNRLLDTVLLQTLFNPANTYGVK